MVNLKNVTFLSETQDKVDNEPKSLYRKASGGARGGRRAAPVSAHHQAVDVEHLLAALLEDDQGLAASILKLAGVDRGAVQQKPQTELEKVPQRQRRRRRRRARPT